MATTLVLNSGLVNFADQGVIQQLGQIDFSQFAHIRVSAWTTFDSAGNVTLTLVHVVGVEFVTTMAQLVLAPGSQISAVYDVPGTVLNVTAEGSGGSTNQDSIQVLIYGA